MKVDGDQRQQAQSIVAHLFQRSGQSALSESEMANALSLDLGWFAPKEARKLVAGLVRAGVLQHTEDGDLEPVFDVRAHRVPLGFRPGPKLVAALPPPGAGGQSIKAGETPRSPPREQSSGEQGDVGARQAPRSDVSQAPAKPADDDLSLAALLQRFADESGEEMGAWVNRMEQVVQETGDLLVPEVALLLAASRHGQDVRDPAASLRKKLETSRAA